jgi:hypothetical protein
MDGAYEQAGEKAVSIEGRELANHLPSQYIFSRTCSPHRHYSLSQRALHTHNVARGRCDSLQGGGGRGGVGGGDGGGRAGGSS